MHFNKSPHASEHIYYPFSGTVEPEEIGAAETTDAELSNELRWGQGRGFRFEICPWHGCCTDVTWVLQLVNIY